MYYKDFDPSNLSFEKTEDNTIKVYYNENDLLLSTPKLVVKNNLNLEDDTPVLKFVLPKKNIQIYNVFAEIDKELCKWIHKNNSEFFKKKISYEGIEDILKPTVKLKKLNDTGTISINVFPEMIKIYDRNTVEVKMDNFGLDTIIKKDLAVRICLRLIDIKVKNNVIKTNWTLIQIKLNEIINDCQIVESDSDVDDYQSN